MTNTALLKKKIQESGYKVYYIATRCGLTYPGLQPKINGEREFTQIEMSNLRDILKLSADEFDAIFFAQNVEETSTK